jgi:hypothetical protein
MGNGHYIGNVFIPRKTISRNYAKHYTTKVIERNSNNEIIAIDGFSLTDTNYIYQFDREIGRKIVFRTPRHGNSMFIINGKDGIIIPKMSYDVMGSDYETREFYLKPILKTLGFKDVDSLLNSALIYDQNGKIDYAKNVKPSYMPYLRELTYDKPDLTIMLYTCDDGIEKSIIDIYNEYYFNVAVMDRLFEKSRVLLFMGYIYDIYGIIPFIKPVKRVIDGWRNYTMPLDFVNNEWVKLTDSEWCGWTSKSEYMLKELEDQLIKLLQLGVFESLATVISYSSNIFVTYIDFYVKKSDFDSNVFKYKIEHVVKQIQNLEVKEIIENVLNL